VLTFGQALNIGHLWNNYWTFLPVSICFYYFWKAFVFVWAPSDDSDVKIWLLFIFHVQSSQAREEERALTDFFSLPLTCVCWLFMIYVTTKILVTLLCKQARNNFINTPWDISISIYFYILYLEGIAVGSLQYQLHTKQCSVMSLQSILSGKSKWATTRKKRWWETFSIS